MDWGWLVVVVVGAVLLLCGIYLWASYNSFVHANARVDEAWAEVLTEVRRRSELLPPLISAVAEYAPDEKAVFDRATRARSDALAAEEPTEAGRAESHLQQAVRSVLVVADAYPKLQSDKDFLQLQHSLREIDDQIQVCRRHYNGGVRELNAKITVFPNSWFAKHRGYSARAFFEADGATVSEPPRIQF